MIPLPNELERVERDLLNRKITGNEASEIVFIVRKKLGPPWQWKSWKVARQKVIGTECETCGAGREAILYLQHTFKNPRVRPYIQEAHEQQKLFEQDGRGADLRSKMYGIQGAVVPDLRDCCPVCGSLSIQYRKGVATWICNSKSNGDYCRHVFVEPSRRAALTPSQKKSIRRKKYAAYREVVLNNECDFKRDAMLNWFKDMRRYLSLKDTKTLCKSCAYIEDFIDV